MSEITAIKVSTKGFTLAEVLITLMIVGVVASLIIKSLIPKTQDAEFKAAFKKEYSDTVGLWQGLHKTLPEAGL